MENSAILINKVGLHLISSLVTRETENYVLVYENDKLIRTYKKDNRTCNQKMTK